MNEPTAHEARAPGANPQDAAPTATSPSVVLAARALTKAYGSHTVLSGVDIDLFAGRVAVLMGENGAGKSTLMRALAGELPFDRGAVRIGGVDLDADPDAARRHLVHVAQDPPLSPFLTPREHLDVLVGHRGLAPDDAADALQRHAAALGMADVLDRPCHALSGGTRRKAAIALAFASDARVILLDEPLAGLDLRSALALREQVRARAAAGVGFLVSSHLAESVLAIADRVLVLRHGAWAADWREGSLTAWGDDVRGFEQAALKAMSGAGAAPTASPSTAPA